MLRSEVYFDNAATTPLHPEVKTAMTEAMELFGNPTSIHAEGRRSRVFIEDCRAKAASLLGLQPAELFFTSGGTESLQTVLSSVIRQGHVSRILTTPLEHPAVLKNIEALSQWGKIEVDFVLFDVAGRINPDELDLMLANGVPTLVVLMHANNETGMLLPLKKTAEVCRKHQALFLSDTVQTIGKYSINLSQGPDFAVASAHKFHGPKGSGFLTIKGGTGIEPMIKGGGQERNMRSGTENIIGIAGMVKALEVALVSEDPTTRHIVSLRQKMLDGLRIAVPDLMILTDTDHSLHTILNVGFPKSSMGDMLVYRLDMAGIAVSGGSACASGVNNPSHVLEGLGVSQDYSHIRFSFSRFNTLEEVEKCVNLIKNIRN